MAIRSDEITSVIRTAIEGFDSSVEMRSVGTVIEVGSAVANVHIGDRLLVSCSSARGHQRSLLHRCRLVAEADGQSSHATSSTPGWTRPSPPGPTARSTLGDPGRAAGRTH